MKSYFRVCLYDASNNDQLLDKFYVSSLRDISSILRRYELHNVVVKFYLVEDE